MKLKITVRGLNMKLIAFIALILLTGCAAKSDKAPSSLSEQYKNDLAICKKDVAKEMTRTTAGSGIDSNTMNNTNAVLREEELTNLCMMAKDVY